MFFGHGILVWLLFLGIDELKFSVLFLEMAFSLGFCNWYALYTCLVVATQLSNINCLLVLTVCSVSSRLRPECPETVLLVQD
jgi:ABC-type spermidine/putrescine transport system permease subunit I